jgi:hypothetical protein
MDLKKDYPSRSEDPYEWPNAGPWPLARPALERTERLLHNFFPNVSSDKPAAVPFCPFCQNTIQALLAL